MKHLIMLSLVLSFVLVGCGKTTNEVNKKTETVTSTVTVGNSPATTTCSSETLRCANGTYVGRDPSNNCNFRACPTSTNTVVCPADVKDCGNTIYVSRDPANACQFPACPTTGGGSTVTYNPGCEAPGIPRATGLNNDYYNFGSIVAHGWGNVTAYSDPPTIAGYPRNIAWSSIKDSRTVGDYSGAPDRQIRFLSDSKLSFKVLAKESVGKVNDSMGNYCKMLKLSPGYTKMEVTVGVRPYNGTPGNYTSQKTFYNIPINDCSEPQQFTLPPNDPNGPHYPFVVEIINVKWNYSCVNGNSSYCPYEPAWANDCFEIGLLMATDSTVELPASH